MKKPLLLFASLLFLTGFSQAQTVTLASTTANPTKGTVVFNNITNQLQYWNGSVWIVLNNPAAGTGWASSGPHIYKANDGNVGIGTLTPTSALTVNANGIGITQENPEGTTQVGFSTSGSNAYVQTHTDNDLRFTTNASGTNMVIQKGTGNVGIGTLNPVNKLQIGTMTYPLMSYYDLVLTNGPNAMGIFQGLDEARINSTTNIILNPNIYSNGKIGINVSYPVNKFQINPIFPPSIIGYDFAIGNNDQGIGIYQGRTYASIASSTDIVLRPRLGSAGFVGINTTTPRGPLDVRSSSDTTAIPYAYFQRNQADGLPVVSSTTSGSASISIYADKAVLATQYVAISDARIKNIVGISNAAKDLAILRNLEITDYTMKDQAQYGNKSFKKVIAQQVEQVYPQAITKVTDIVPDIYALAENITYNKINKTLTCSLAKNYSIKAGEKLQFIHPTEGKLKAEVIEVSDNTFTVKDWQHPTDKIFVYGREVNDFRSVDYEAISMLGISAIQQLAKENEELKKQLKELKSDFSARLEAIEAALEAQLPKIPTGN